MSLGAARKGLSEGSACQPGCEAILTCTSRDDASSKHASDIVGKVAPTRPVAVAAASTVDGNLAQANQAKSPTGSFKP